MAATIAAVLTAGKVALFTVSGADSATPPNPASITGTVSVDDYASAYIAKTGKANEYMLVPKITLNPGQKVTVNVTFSAIASDGTKIADFAVGFELDGAPEPVATQLVLGAVTTPNAADVSVPGDPGSASISI